MSKVKIKVKEDYRCFKKGDEYTLDLIDNEPNMLVGLNGSGKSTLLRVLRHMKDTFHDQWIRAHDGVIPQQFDSIDASKFEVDGLDQFSDVFYIDMQIDDPASFACSATAESFIELGGYTASRISRGQTTMTMLGKVVHSIEEYYKANPQKPALVVLDEIDEGFDLNILINFAEKTKRIFHQYNPNTTLLICTHNPIVYLNYDVHMVSLSHITIVPGDLYFNTVTGWNMTLEKCESSK